MPLIMDEPMEVDIDDLFGDGADLQLAAPTQPPPSKELIQRVDELRASGACQSVAWSRNGSIASISKDGTELEFRALHSSPVDGAWKLSRPTVMTPFRSNLDGGPLKHLSWSTNGNDLAVIDAAGRVSILSITFLLNRPDVRRDCRTETSDDLHAVVGTFWLNLLTHPPNRPSLAHGPAVKTGSKYAYEMAQLQNLGPLFPSVHKSAFLCVTANGMLRLFWSTNMWYEQSIELESVTSSDELITHAAICADKGIPGGTLLVAFTTSTKQLRVIRVGINWGLPNPNDKSQGPGPMAINPTIHTKHVAATSWMADATSDSLESLSDGQSADQVSLLEFLHPSPEVGTRLTLPTILIARTQLPSATQPNQEPRTVVDRWELTELEQSLHPAFEQLGRKNSGSGSQQTSKITILKKLEPLSVNKVLVNIEPIILGKFLFMAYSDGSIEYRDRRTLVDLSVDGNAQKFMHLSQINFSYLNAKPCVSAVSSPTSTSAIQLGFDGELVWKSMDYNMGGMGTSLASEPYAATISAFSMICATAVLRSTNFDDILATGQKYLTPSFAHDWLNELAKLIKMPVDYSEELHHQLLFRNVYIQMYLGFQQSLGFRGDFSRRSFSSKLATISLQLRNVVVVFTTAANSKIPGPDGQAQSLLDDPGIVKTLSGSMRWCIDLMHWLTDSALEIAHDHGSGSAFTQEQLQSLSSTLISENNITLHLLMSSASRGFLIALCRRITHLSYTASKAEATRTGISLENREAWTKLSTELRSARLPVSRFEKLLNDLSAAIKKTYAANPHLNIPQAANAGQGEMKTEIQSSQNPRTPIELALMTGAPLPVIFAPTLHVFFSEILPALRDEILPDQLFFRDYSLLQLGDSEADLRQRRKKAGVALDSLRKVEIRTIRRPPPAAAAAAAASLRRDRLRAKDGSPSDRDTDAEPIHTIGNLRRCARCAGLMENNFAGNKSQLVQWMINYHKRCFCGGSWLGLEEKVKE